MNKVKSLKTLILVAASYILSAAAAVSAPFAHWTKSELILDNGLVKRVIKLPSPAGNFLTKSYQPVTGEFKYFQSANADFQFEINGAIFSGKSEWSLSAMTAISDLRGGDGAAVTLLSTDK